MKKSESNRLVIENFILFFTHQDLDEATGPAAEMYAAVDGYIADDHVDGVDGDGEAPSDPHEVGMIAVIMSDCIMKRLYEKQNEGYMQATDTIARWAVEFEDKFRHVGEWDMFCSTYKSLSGVDICAWDDVVMDYAQYKFQRM